MGCCTALGVGVLGVVWVLGGFGACAVPGQLGACPGLRLPGAAPGAAAPAVVPVPSSLGCFGGAPVGWCHLSRGGTSGVVLLLVRGAAVVEAVVGLAGLHLAQRRDPARRPLALLPALHTLASITSPTTELSCYAVSWSCGPGPRPRLPGVAPSSACSWGHRLRLSICTTPASSSPPSPSPACTTHPATILQQ